MWSADLADFKQFLFCYQQRIRTQLSLYLPAEHDEPQALHRAMRYTVLAGGKQLRPLLVYAAGLDFGVPAHLLDIPAVVVECIHAYSLIHDDLPAMDDDAIRRGKPSCHKAFGEATAILAGDALHSLAFELLSRNNALYTPTQQTAMLHCLAQACGSYGMAGGQQLDLAAADKKLSLDEAEKISILKTATLICASVKLGAIAANCNAMQINTLSQFATALGLAFQLQDDLFDNDIHADTATSQQRLAALFAAADTRLANLAADTTRLLRALCTYIQQRDH